MDTVKIVGRLPSEISVSRRVDASGNLTNDLVLKITGTPDQLTLQNYFVAGGAYKVEKVQFDDGTVWTPAELDGAAIVGTVSPESLSGTTGNDLIQGLAGNDTLTANAGNDVLEGGEGNDVLQNSAGNDLLNGGAGNDTLTGNNGHEIYVGGAGNDTITTGAGADLIAFNRGDGQDIVNASTGEDNTLSLGGGIGYNDLSFSKSANDLVLDVGNSEQITLKDWYSSTANNKSVVNLQMIAEAMADFDVHSNDPLRDNKVESFNFAGLVERFDQARTADPMLTSWSVTNALLDFHLSGSDTAAMGGDLGYQYGKQGSLAGIGLTEAQTVLSHPQFGTAPQTLQPLAGLQEGLVKLG
ncbi:MAG: calcium-binding protein [Gammaproteobacteria bacterium]